VAQQLGFVPWTEKEMRALDEELGQFADLDLVIFAEHKAGRSASPAAMPDLNQVLIKMNGRLFPFGFLKYLIGRRKITGVRAMVFGVVPEFMHTGPGLSPLRRVREGHRRQRLPLVRAVVAARDNQAINSFAARSAQASTASTGSTRSPSRARSVTA